MKWAEEGYAVVGVRVDNASSEEIDQGLRVGEKALKECETCSTKDKLAILGEYDICHNRRAST